MATANQAVTEQSAAEAKTADGYRALRSGVAMRLAPERMMVRMSGDDRVTFLQGMCTNDVAKLAPGALMRALILTEHAHVVADFYAWAESDAILIEIDRSLWPEARAQLERFLVADDVELEEMDAISFLDVMGPCAADAVAVLAGDAARSLPSWRALSAGELRVGHAPRLGLDSFTLVAERDPIAVASARLKASITGLAELSDVELETVRVENGVARVGVDTTEKTLALEARLTDAIAPNKGCYLGQETIERATARGAIKRRLCGLKISTERLPATGTGVSASGKEVGRLTSVAVSPRLGVLGLAILHQSVWTPGTEVTLSDDAGELKALVSDLPFN